MKYFLTVIAMILIIEGLPYFIFPEKLKTVLRLLSQSEPSSLRKIGISLISIGLIILYFVNSL
jgi:uncharacterized protein YjeT (DUF2065 family)